MSPETSRTSVFADTLERDDFSADRIRWLISLRWFAMAGVLIAAGFAIAGYFPGVAWPVFLAVVVAGSAVDGGVVVGSLVSEVESPPHAATRSDTATNNVRR